MRIVQNLRKKAQKLKIAIVLDHSTHGLFLQRMRKPESIKMAILVFWVKAVFLLNLK